MRVFRNIEETEYNYCTALTVGTFDGVHLGHQRIFGKLKEVSRSKNIRSLVVTFEPHPQIVLRSKSPDIKVLSTLEEKLDIFRSLDIDSVLVIEFTREFAGTGAEEFYRDYLIRRAGMCDLVIGYDHMFGRNREGNFEMMKGLSAKYGFTVDRVDEYMEDGHNLSSTSIRNFITAGDVRRAAVFLGRNYSISGTVTEGRKLGRQLLMPTANIAPDYEYKLIPAFGVYAVTAEVEGRLHGGVMNIGTNPTVTDDRSVKLEVNIFDFEGDIYGSRIKVDFIERIREEKRFGSLDELKQNMQDDKAIAGKILKNSLFNNTN